MKLHIPVSIQSRLLGKGGETVRGLQEKHHVRIRIPRRNENNVIVHVEGDKEKVAASLPDIQEALEGFKPGEGELRTVELAIEEGNFPALIGRGGSVIKQLKRDSGALVDIPKRNRRPEDSSHVRLVGQAACVDAAKAAIDAILNSSATVVSDTTKSEADVRAALPRIDLTKRIAEVLFFPDVDGSDGFNLDRFLAFLRSATTTLDVCVFTISDDRISGALADAADNGVKVRIITDDDTMANEGSDIVELAQKGIPVRTDDSPAHMHHKFAVLDGKCVLTGSFNWTSSASAVNNENITISTDPSLVRPYIGEFDRLWSVFAANTVQ